MILHPLGGRLELMAFADECNRTAGFAARPESTRRGRMKWLRQYERQQGLCAICGQWRAPVEMTRDHIVPRSRGGDSDWQNIRLCCRECNETKGDSMPSNVKVKGWRTALVDSRSGQRSTITTERSAGNAGRSQPKESNGL